MLSFERGQTDNLYSGKHSPVKQDDTNLVKVDTKELCRLDKPEVNDSVRNRQAREAELAASVHEGTSRHPYGTHSRDQA